MRVMVEVFDKGRKYEEQILIEQEKSNVLIKIIEINTTIVINKDSLKKCLGDN